MVSKPWKLKNIQTRIGLERTVDILIAPEDSFEKYYDEWDNNDGQNYVFPIEHIELALTVQENSFNLASPRKLRRSYLWSKKIKLAVYKLITYLPKILSGNYKRKTNSENNQ